jgi:Fe(3+) dicitrate transport protein
VFFSPELVAGQAQRSTATSPEQALRQLLQGSGLDYQINDGSVTLAPAATAASNGPLELGVTDIKVVGDWLVTPMPKWCRTTRVRVR